MNLKDIESKIPELIKQYKSLYNIPIERFTSITNVKCFTFLMEDILPIFKGFHFHDDIYEILYMVDGSSQYIIEDKIYNLEKGDMVLVCPNQLHQLISPNYSKRIICSFTPDYLDSLKTSNTNFKDIFEVLQFTGNNKISFQNNDLAKVETLFTRMTKLLFSDQFGDDLQYNLSFSRIMLLIAEKLFDDKDLTDVSYLTHPIIKNIIDYINQNLSNKITIKNISDKLALSPSYLSHIFKENTGVSILQFIIKKRLVHSKELLRQGKRIEDIAQECGFMDYTSFFRSFKKEFGITPKKYIQDYLIHI